MNVPVVRKPRKCPNCGSHRIATYGCGMPQYSAELRKELDEGSIVLGGCEVGNSMPDWVCTECKTDFLKSDRKSRKP